MIHPELSHPATRPRNTNGPGLDRRTLSRRFVEAMGEDSGLAPTNDAAARRLFRWVTLGMFALYIVAAIGIFLWRGQSFRPDNWAIFLLVGALLLGRPLAFIRDWIPFVLLVFGYEFLRGIAGEFVT
ncbi:MAG TPA: hypothetical protein VEW66_01995, partial [Thermomicrobiales bacterium]|nr:hypothetical protein [Thermomicrobiales bacterium]